VAGCSPSQAHGGWWRKIAIPGWAAMTRAASRRGSSIAAEPITNHMAVYQRQLSQSIGR
jgi:hypothetical protein